MNYTLKKKIATIPGVRFVILKLLRSLAKDTTIQHPYTNKPLLLNTYKHKGYWYYSSDRESRTMRSFKEIITPGDVVIEVGGHIGFISMFFSSLIGKHGQLIVFEPGKNNLYYTHANLSPLFNTRIIEKGCSDVNDVLSFYEDNITGQNNSLLENYLGAAGVANTHGVDLVKNVRKIDVIRLDEFIRKEDLEVDFIKIDVEGAEKDVLIGMGNYLGKIQKIMVEVSENHKFIVNLLHEKGYELFQDDLMTKFNPEQAQLSNVFAVLKS